MPDIMREYHIWWLDFWSAHPFLFWGAIASIVAAKLICKKIWR